MANTLEGCGWVYFIISLIASAIIWANAEVLIQDDLYDYVKEVSLTIVAYGFAVLIQGIMVLVVFLALAKILRKLD